MQLAGAQHRRLAASLVQQHGGASSAAAVPAPTERPRKRANKAHTRVAPPQALRQLVGTWVCKCNMAVRRAACGAFRRVPRQSREMHGCRGCLEAARTRLEASQRILPPPPADNTLFAPPPPLPQPRNVCIAVDPSETSQHALRWAVRSVINPGDKVRQALQRGGPQGRCAPAGQAGPLWYPAPSFLCNVLLSLVPGTGSPVAVLISVCSAAPRLPRAPPPAGVSVHGAAPQPRVGAQVWRGRRRRRRAHRACGCEGTLSTAGAGGGPQPGSSLCRPPAKADPPPAHAAQRSFGFLSFSLPPCSLKQTRRSCRTARCSWRNASRRWVGAGPGDEGVGEGTRTARRRGGQQRHRARRGVVWPRRPPVERRCPLVAPPPWPLWPEVSRGD